MGRIISELLTGNNSRVTPQDFSSKMKTDANKAVSGVEKQQKCRY